MKLNKALLLAPVALLSLASCAKMHQRHKITDYFISYIRAKNAIPLNDDGDFNILQLSDLHMSMEGDASLHYQFIKKTIDEAKEITGNKLHLIVITGDLFTFANKSTVKELCDFFEAQNTPWTLTFGNHDEQGYFSIDWMTNYLTALSRKNDSNLLFRDYPDDDVFGSANFVITLPSYPKEATEGEQNRQIVMIDSNRYNYGEGYGYDYIHYDQIDWYKRVYEHANELDNDDLPPNSLAFFHIPVPEFTTAFNDASINMINSKFLHSNQYVFKDGAWPDAPEEVERKVHDDTSDGAPEINTGFYETARKDGYIKGMFVGHAHTNTNCEEYLPSNSTGNSIALCYGVKATDRIYCDENMMGGQLIHYHAEEKTEGAVWDGAGSNWFDLDLIYHKYSDLKEGK